MRVFDHSVVLSVFLSVVLLVGSISPTLLIQEALANPFTAVASGSWFDPLTWGGTSPRNVVGPGVTVIIPAGITVSLPSEIENRGTIINQGILIIQNPSGTGISSFGGGAVNNSGTINVSNTGGNGMRFGSSTTGILINSGTITIANGSTQSGIVISAPGSVTNTGTIVLANTGGTSIDSVGTFNNIPPGQILQKCDATYSGIPTPINQCLFSIDNVSIFEGNLGATTATFTVTIPDQTHSMPLTVSFSTANGMTNPASTPSDYLSTFGVLNFAPGEYSKPILVTINGDTTFELDEIFFVNLSSASGALKVGLGISQGVGTIKNDDVLDSIPDAVDDTVLINEDTPSVIQVLSNDSGLGDVPILLSIVAPTNGIALVNGDNTITYTPNADYHGPDSFKYTITDTDSDTDTATVSITVSSQDDIPTAMDDVVSTNEDSAIIVNVLSNDVLGNNPVIGDQPITIELLTQGGLGTATLFGNSITYTPNLNLDGADSFKYQITDQDGDSSSATVNINILPINDVPTADSNSVTMDEDAVIMTTLYGTDIDGDSLTFSIVSGPSNGILGIISQILPNSATITYTPNPNYSGTDSFTFKADDGHIDSNIATISITIIPVNDSPIANDDNVATDEDTAANFDVIPNDSDVDGDALSVISVTNGATGGASINSDGTIHYVPTPNYSGTDSFTYDISDGNGGTDTATVTVSIGGTNDAPIAENDAYSISEDGILIVPAPGIIENDSDVDEDALSAVEVSSTIHGTLTLHSDGSFTYTPNENYSGVDSFAYYAQDNAVPPLDSGVATVTIHIISVNDPPVLDNDSATTLEDTPIIIPVLDGDSDIEGPLTITSVTNGANGFVQIIGDEVKYSPNLNYFGDDSFTYTVRDSDDVFATASVSVVVLPVNDPPTVQTLITDISSAEDTPVDIDLSGIFADVDSIVSLSSDAPSWLVINPANHLIGIPPTDFNGLVMITVTASDGEFSISDSFVLDITPVNDAPLATSDSYNMVEDNTLSILSPGILENDSDVDSTDLDVILMSGTSNGALALTSDGSLTYTPNLNYYGIDSFTYRAFDGALLSGIATVTITITPANDSPTANAGSDQTVPEDTLVTLSGIANDIDDDLLVISWTQTAGPAVILSNPDTLIPTFTAPSVLADTILTFQLLVDDVLGGTAADTVNVLVTDEAVVVLYCGLEEGDYASIIDGTQNNDNLSGTNNADLIRGFGGNDKIKGKGGNDCIIGGDGADRIWGGDGNDTIRGDAGFDKLNGGKGDDLLYGGEGNDRLWGSKGNDDVFGDAGNDWLYGGEGNDDLSGGDGNDGIWGGKGSDNIDAGAGNDVVHANQDNDTISGGPGDDWLGAGNGNDIIFAGDGNDKLYGREGNDTLSGEGDNDLIHGGSGNDVIDGGETPNPATDSDRCHGGSGTNNITNCEITRGSSDDSEEERHDSDDGDDEEPES